MQRVLRQPHRSARTELGRGHCLVPVVSLALLPDVLALRGLTRPHQPTEGVWHVHDENSLRVTAVQAGAGLGAGAEYRHSAMLPPSRNDCGNRPTSGGLEQSMTTSRLPTTYMYDVFKCKVGEIS